MPTEELLLRPFLAFFYLRTVCAQFLGLSSMSCYNREGMDPYSQPTPPPVPPPLPVPPKKEDNTAKYLLIAGGGCLLFLLFAGAVGFFVYYIFQKTADPVKVVNQQLTALRENDLEKAYSYCSSGFKQITNYQNFETFVQGNPHLKNSKEFTSSNRAIEQGVAKLKGTLVSLEGSTVPAEYHLVREGTSWKVQFIDLASAGTAQQQQPSPPAQPQVSNEGGTPGQPAREKNLLDNVFGSNSGLRFDEVKVEKGQQGDLTTITIRFKVLGFETDRGGNQPRIHLLQDLATYGPNGNLLSELSKDGIKDLEDFGTFDYADLWNSLSIPSSYPRGRYECRLTVHDKVSGRDAQTTTSFELE